jgi:hypothetical protein
VLAASHVDATENKSTVAPPEVVAEWQRGTWIRLQDVFPYSGFAGEDAYDDPKVTPAHPLPLKPPYDARWKYVREQAIAGRNVLDIGNRCLPLGMPFVAGFGIIQFLFANDRVVTTGLFDNYIRIIYTDGRPHKPESEPTFNGDSIGHWEGNTLVVETVNIKPETLVEVGLTHTDAMRVVERWTYKGSGTLVNDVTVYDDKLLTHPLHRAFTWTHDPNGTVFEDVCEVNRDVNVNGATMMIGPDGKPLVPGTHGRAKYKVIEDHHSN